MYILADTVYVNFEPFNEYHGSILDGKYHAVYLMANVVHPGEAPDVHFGRHSILEF